MPPVVLWYILGAVFLSVLYFKRGAILGMVQDRLEFQKQYNQIKKEAYKKERLKQAKVQRIAKARQTGILDIKLGTNLRNLEEDKTKNKNKKDPKREIEKLLGV